MANQSRFIANNGLDNNSKTIVNVADPVNAQDAATKNFASNASNITSGTLNTALVPDFNTLLTKVSSTPAIFPVLNLDFINAKTLDPRITFTRNSNATRIGKTGLIEYVPHNLLTRSVPDAGVPTGWSVGFATGTYSHTLVSATGPLSGSQLFIKHDQTVSGRSYLSNRVTLLPSTTYTLTVRFDKANCTISSGSTAVVVVEDLIDVTGTFSAPLSAIPADGILRITFTTGGAVDADIRIGIGSYANATGSLVFGAWQLNVDDVDVPQAYDYYPTTSSAYYGPRFDYDPVTFAAKGLLIEEQRTNLVLNSLMNGGFPSTQVVTVSATTYTLSFYGTGTITLSGTHSATVVGTGVYPDRKIYTFTPTAGALTVTKSGTVQFVQLEAGPFATSFIPTTTSQVTRAADVAVMTGTNFSSWFNPTEGAFFAESNRFAAGGTNRQYIVCEAGINAFNNNELIQLGSQYNTTNFQLLVQTGGVAQANLVESGTTASAKYVGAYKQDNFAYTKNGALSLTDTSGNLPVGLNQFNIGSRPAFGNSGFLNGHIRRIAYFSRRLPNGALMGLTL